MAGKVKMNGGEKLNENMNTGNTIFGKHIRPDDNSSINMMFQLEV